MWFWKGWPWLDLLFFLTFCAVFCETWTAYVRLDPYHLPCNLQNICFHRRKNVVWLVVLFGEDFSSINHCVGSLMLLLGGHKLHSSCNPWDINCMHYINFFAQRKSCHLPGNALWDKIVAPFIAVSIHSYCHFEDTNCIWALIWKPWNAYIMPIILQRRYDNIHSWGRIIALSLLCLFIHTAI